MISLAACVPAELSALGLVRSALADALRREGWTSVPVGRVLTASTEAIANALEHGSASGAGVDVAFRVSGRAALVRVLDRGDPQSDAALADPHVPAVTSTRGRGGILMRDLADHLEVRRRGRGTEVRLGFRSECDGRPRPEPQEVAHACSA